MGVQCSPAGRALVARFEGRIPHAYLDQVGKPTVGIGHLIRPGESFGPILPVWDKSETVSDETIDALFAADIAGCEQSIDRNLAGVALNQNQVDALCAFVFNLGVGILNRGHTLADALRHGADDASDAFVLYDHAGGVENADLKARRLAEKALFETPAQVEDCPVTPRSA